MARFFHNFRNGSSLSTELIDLTGMDMRTCSSLYRSFNHCNCETIKLTPASGPQSLISANAAFNNCTASTINIENIFSGTTIDVSYAIANCQQLTTLNIDSSSNSLGIGFNAHAFLFNCVKLEKFELTVFNGNYLNPDFIFPLCARSMFQSMNSLTSLDISNLREITMYDIKNFIYNTPNLTEIKMRDELIDPKCFYSTTHNASTIITQSYVTTDDGKRNAYTDTASIANLDYDGKSYKFWQITASGITTKYYSRAAFLVFACTKEYYNSKFSSTGAKDYYYYIAPTQSPKDKSEYINPGESFTLILSGREIKEATLSVDGVYTITMDYPAFPLST